MKRFVLIITILISGFAVFAQNTEEQKVQKSIEQFFKGMAAKDSVLIKAVMHKAARLNSVAVDNEGKPVLQESTITSFIKQISTLPADVNIEERILSYEIRVDGNLATTWTPYQFYVNGKLSHCGIDAFQLFKDESGIWKITQIADTRRKDKCE